MMDLHAAVILTIILVGVAAFWLYVIWSITHMD